MGSKIELQQKSSNLNWSRTCYGKKPRFDVNFPEKSGEKVYVNFDLEYILKYSEEVPLKYHKLKSEYIVRLAEEVRSQVADDVLDQVFSGEVTVEEENCHEQAGNIVLETPAKVNANPGKGKQKRNTKPAVAEKSQKKAKPVYDPSSDLDESDVESDSEPEDDNADLEDAYADDESGNESTEITADKWGFVEMPTNQENNFTGHPGPKHTLPASANPFQYFSLFIPTYFWAQWAIFTIEH